MPEPRISSQPSCLQTRHPPPPQRKQSTSTSADGSVNGKNDGRNRVRDRGPNISRANRSSVPLRSPMVISVSTASPSTWWNMGECVMSASRRYTLPGQITRTGGGSAFMVRICTGEVWVRRRASADTWKVSCMSRAGWSSGKLRAAKL